MHACCVQSKGSKRKKKKREQKRAFESGGWRQEVGRLPEGSHVWADRKDRGRVGCEALGGSIFQAENTLSHGTGLGTWSTHTKQKLVLLGCNTDRMQDTLMPLLRTKRERSTGTCTALALPLHLASVSEVSLILSVQSTKPPCSLC